MREHDVIAMAWRLMSHHGLNERGWDFKFDNAAKRLGLCNHSQRTISLSRKFVSAATEAEVEQTLLHEIAHALLPARNAHGKTTGHGPEWRRMAYAIGYRGERTSHNPYSATTGTRALEPQLNLRLETGDIVMLRGRGLGIVVKRMKTRFEVIVEGGKTYSSPPELLSRPESVDESRVADLKAALRLRLATAAKPLRVGARGRLTSSGKYNGYEVTIVGVGRTNYKIRFDGEHASYTVKFSLVEGI